MRDAGLVARACERKLRIRRIDALDFRRRATLGQKLGERAVTATDVDPAQRGSRLQPIEEHLAGDPAPRPHHPLIAGAVVEADLRFSHGECLSFFGMPAPRTPVGAGMRTSGAPAVKPCASEIT